jgi:hypothetical protein
MGFGEPEGELLANVSSLEFKEIRKEWKARKKEEENQRKAEEERQRQAAQAAAAQGGGQDGQPADGTPTSTYPATRPTLPPIGSYPPGQYPGAPGSVPQQGLPDYQGHMYPNYPPSHSPYGQGPQPGMYSQGQFSRSGDVLFVRGL